MWFSRSQRIVHSHLFKGYTDCHSHLLPGVDDGVPTLPESLKILALLESLGVCNIWLTPHIMEDTPNTTTSLRENFRQLSEAYRGSLLLHLASENMLDNLFLERLAANDLLPLGPKSDHLLVETSFFNPPINFLATLSAIQECGYHPVLAHPERYQYMNMADYTRLREMNVKFQLNLPSLSGAYGQEAQQKAVDLLNKGCYHCYGTDIHSLHFLERFLETKIAGKHIKKILTSQPSFI